MNKYECTIAIVVRNGEKLIANCIRSIINQDISNDNYEIFIVDGCSTDKTVEISNSILKKTDIKFQILPNPNETLAYGWNIAIQKANSNFILRVDAHAEISSNYLSKAIEKFSNNERLMAIGGVLKTKSDSEVGKLISIVLSNPIGVGTSLFRIGVKKDTFSDTVVYGVYKSEIFKLVGGFNESLKRNQDIDLHKRILAKKFLLMTCPEMQAIYYSRPTVRTFLQQGYQNGFWVTRGSGWHFRHLIPLLFLLSIILLALCYINAVLFYILMYFFIVALAFIQISKIFNPLKIIILIFLTFSLHLIYGLGSFLGLFVSVLKKGANKLNFLSIN